MFKMILSSLLFLMAGYSSASTEAQLGISLRSGDQMIIRGMPVACEAPLPRRAKYRFYCDDHRVKGLSTFVFIDSAQATEEHISERRKAIIVDRGIDPIDCVLTPGWQGPFDISKKFDGAIDVDRE